MIRGENRLSLKIPPLVLTFLAGLLMWFISGLTSWASVAIPAAGSLAMLPAIAGGLIALAGVLDFRKAGTTVDPLHPERATQLVVSGIYGVTRNPMYLGFLLWLVALALYLGNPFAFFLLPAFIIWMNRFQIEPEEAELHRIFGEEFEAYSERVRRWC